MAGRKKGTSREPTAPQTSEPLTEDQRESDSCSPQPLPAQPPAGKEIYTGTRVNLSDGTVAHYRDYGNADGVTVHLDLPEGVGKPADGVTEPLKERRPGHTSFGYAKPFVPKKRWHKDVTGPGLNPVAERLDAEDRFQRMLTRQEETGQGEDKGR